MHCSFSESLERSHNQQKLHQYRLVEGERPDTIGTAGEETSNHFGGNRV
jgi:hypothetical protein